MTWDLCAVNFGAVKRTSSSKALGSNEVTAEIPTLGVGIGLGYVSFVQSCQSMVLDHLLGCCGAPIDMEGK